MILSFAGFVTSLTKLWIQSNKLVSLPRTIGLVLIFKPNSVLFSGKALFGTFVQLLSLCNDFRNLTNLTDLRVGENNLTSLPEEIG